MKTISRVPTTIPTITWDDICLQECGVWALKTEVVLMRSFLQNKIGNNSYSIKNLG